jgi:hypothetical protein
MSECIILITVPGEEIVKFSLRHLLLSVTIKYPPQKIFLKEARNNKSPIYRTVSNASSCCNTACMQYSTCTLLAAAK